MSTILPLYFLHRVLQLQPTMKGQLLLLAIVAIAYWYTIPPRKGLISAAPVFYVDPRFIDPFGPCMDQKETPLPDDDTASYDDPQMLALTSLFAACNLGPGLRKSTSKIGKSVRLAEERNTMRYATKYIGLEDQDSVGEQYTVDGLWIPDRDERRSNLIELFLAAEEEEEPEEIYRQDDDGDFEMTDAEVGMDVNLFITI